MKLKASTLVEVLIALLIIMAVFVSGMIIFANITKSARSQTLRKVQGDMKVIQATYESYPIDTDEEVTEDSIRYTIQIIGMEQYPSLKRISVVAYRPNRTLPIDSLVVLKEISDEQQ